MTTHDYTVRDWGHDYTFTPSEGGQRGSMMGWGHGIEAGHYLLIRNGAGSTRYQVETISYFRDPADMWSAQVVFAPRPAPEHAAH